MINKKFSCVGLAASLYSFLVFAQDDVWSGLARSQFDSTAATLRVPCAIVEDESGSAVPGLAPAYALNLFLASLEAGNERFQLVDPITAYTEVPASCLDTLIVSNAGTTATYTTSSTEIDIDAAVFADRFYTLELQANLLTDGPVEFSVVNVTSRLYRKPSFVGETFLATIGPPPFNTQFIYDDGFLGQALVAMNQGLVVFEPGRVRVDCFFEDPNSLLEVFEVIGSNVRHKLKSTVTSADNNKEIRTRCTVFNLDINRLDRDIQIYTWFINL
ncbi:MAG: hypothetical protein O2971_01790 [Proteobacteria bacterium]|nr:hypothetical protein [Pseudomonadota bacterium]